MQAICMSVASPVPVRPRQRAPSQRSLATRSRILDAAETVFASKGFDGATIRDIAAIAGEPTSLVHHHGGGKEQLFRQTIARRADDLAEARLAALGAAKKAAGEGAGAPALDAVIGAFVRPFFQLAGADDQWRAYARLVAHVSADARWRDLAAAYFDPTAVIFMDEIAAAAPGCSRRAVATGFIFSVSAMLALLTAQWRIEALGGGAPDAAEIDADVERLIAHCTAGILA